MTPRSRQGYDTACLLLLDAKATEIQEDIDDLECGNLLKFADYWVNLKNNIDQRTDITDTNKFAFLVGLGMEGRLKCLQVCRRRKKTTKRQSTSSISVSILSARSSALTH